MNFGIRIWIFLFRTLFPIFLLIVCMNIIAIIGIDKVPVHKTQVIIIVSLFIAWSIGYILQYIKSVRVIAWNLIGFTTVAGFIFYCIVYFFATYT
ncbi:MULTISPECIES: hypothetical protein [Bacillus cereus group]|uniref:Uncharacterized protein n=1 Tax=Bacillus cereus TaxID=1396 RepID=A0AA44TE84_BACCE|nr:MULTISPECIES: hypothetical protein [Bacillus cereus group]PFA22611.1 hypothetical protein CN373_08405 [Bacillus cereus]PFN08773.1 hypothetical protein COJ55_05465 [Bacillus cereus]PFR24679.1 hypothetical protein COK19_17605 [Bacillus cereus]PFR99822.1 hypothetical protein COK38_14740 [Bacillus cereus]PGZ15559.1 hypothetical protein COE46_15415 [Bacillus cereus]